MALIGGPTVASAIADPKNELERIVAENADDRQLAEEIFLRSIGRLPKDSELAAFDQIRREIKLDHETLEAHLASQEKAWKERKAELESIRMKSLEETKAQLAARVEAAKPEQERLAKEREERIAKAKSGVAAAEKALQSKIPKWTKDHGPGVEWHPLLASKTSATNKAVLIPQTDRSILATGQKGKGVYAIEFPTQLKGITGLRLEALADKSLPAGGPGLPGNGNFVITEFEVQVIPNSDPKKPVAVAIESGKADFSQGGFDVKQTFDGANRDQRGWAVSNALGVDHWVTYKLKNKIENADGCVLRIQLHQFHNAEDHRLGRFRISATTAEGDIPLDLPDTFRSVVATPDAQRTDAQKQQLLEYLGKTDGGLIGARATLAEANKPVPRDAETVRLEGRRDQLSKPTPDSAAIVRLRDDFKYSQEQLKNIRLTAAEDLTWALINSPAFLFNH